MWDVCIASYVSMIRAGGKIRGAECFENCKEITVYAGGPK